MRKNTLLVLVLAIAAAIFVLRERAPDPLQSPGAAPSVTQGRASPPTDADTRAGEDGSLQRAINGRADGVPVTGRGVVVKLLGDDREGSPHQRILLRVAGGGTVLIAHNLELAPRVEPLAEGDELEFAGDYVWNDKGGVVHWTHPDPHGGHRAGWIRRLPR